MAERSREELRAQLGLCAQCIHSQPIHSVRGSTFWRCSAHDRDPSLPKYPRLPVVSCSAYRPDPGD